MTAAASAEIAREIENLSVDLRVARGETQESGKGRAARSDGEAGDEEEGRSRGQGARGKKEESGEGEIRGEEKVTFRPYWVQRNGLSVRSDWRTLIELKQAFRELQPDAILAYTIKPIIWGAIAARAVPKARFVALVTGLGFAFQGNTLKRRLLNALVVRLYRCALRRADAVMFQNSDNRDEFLNRKIVPPEKCHVVSGSGINVQRFAHSPLPDGPPRFLMIARFLGEKGVREYASAARIVRQQHPTATFSLIGFADPSPDGIPLETVRQWHSEGIIEHVGETWDVIPHLQNCHVYCLPSYHEGMPRTVLEAMAVGRPILTTRVSGCRETVVEGENGWLVPKADAAALAERMVWFIEHPERWPSMGCASRRVAEDRFDVRKVNARMLEILGLKNQPADAPETR